MKQLLLKSFSTCLFIIFISSCQKLYYPDNLDSGKKIPVIQGSINNGPGPYEVTLSWASPFGSQQMDPIEDATVSIYDDNGNQEQLTMSTPGHYNTSKNDFAGIPGRTYTLHVILSNGDIYESIPTKLEIVPMTDSLYEQAGTQEDYETNSYGEILTTTYKGLYCYVDMTVNTPQQHYYYYTTKMISQTFTTLYPNDPMKTFVRFCWKVSYLSAIPNVKATIENNNNETIKGHQLGFIRYHYDPNEANEIMTAPYPVGWILKTSIYSISKEVFNYYQSISQQLNSNNQIFDPISSQIKGNIKCLTDSAKVVLGVFEVASINVRNLGIYWAPGFEVIRHVELPSDYEVPLIGGCKDTIPPDFWIYFK
jgi:hypothetical protein